MLDNHVYAWKLIEELGGSGVFSSGQWCQVWWRHNARGKLLVTLVARDAVGQPVGLLPCLEEQLAPLFPGRVVRPIGRGHGDYIELPHVPGKAREAGDGLADEASKDDRWRVLDLRDIPEDSPLLDPFVEGLRKRGWHVTVRPGPLCPVLSLDGSWDELLARKKAKFRYNLRRAGQGLEAQGEVSFVSFRDRESVAVHFDELLRLHDSQWRGRYTSNSFSSSGQAFYRDLAEQLADRGQADVSFLRVDGKAVAGSLSLLDGINWYYWIPAFDQEHAHWSPGTLLLTRLIQRAFEEAYKEFHFLKGEEAYKFHWSTHTRKLVRLVARKKGARNAIVFYALLTLDGAARRVRSAPRLQSALGRLGARKLLERG